MNAINSWSTWDVECLNAVMKVPELAEVRLAFYDQRTKKYVDRMLWKYVTRFGERSVDGTYFELDLQVEEVVYKLEFASEDDKFIYKIVPSHPVNALKIHVTGMLRWNKKGIVAHMEDFMLLFNGDQRYEITAIGEVDNDTIVNAAHQGILLNSDDDVYIRCNNRMTVTEMNAFLSGKRNNWLRQSVSGGGILADAPQAIVKAMTWNTVYDPTKNRFCTPVTREWCVMSNMTHFGGYVLFSWDTFFGGLLSAIQDKELAYRQVYSVMEEMQDGFAPQYGSQVLTRWDRSNPPVGAYCVLKIYRQFREKELLADVFENLLSWNSWWMNNRDGNGDGLLEWGSNRTFVENAQVVLHESFETAAKMESGLDNSPMYDNVAYNPSGRTLELADVGLSALYAMDCEALARIARELGKDEEATRLDAEYERMKETINRELWNEELGCYCNKHWDGTWSDVLTPTHFYPLIAGIPNKRQADRMISEHLLNETEFWGTYALPSVMKSHPSFQDNDYWRGRIWGPMNFLVYEGLKRYEYLDAAYDLAGKSLKMFLEEWKEDNHIHENYHALTGDGDDVDNADPVYTWGGLLPYLYIEELIDVQTDGGVRFGNLSDDEASIDGIIVGQDTYSVTMKQGLKVERNGIPYLESDVAVRITVKENGGVFSAAVVSRAPGTLMIYCLEEYRQADIRCNGNVLSPSIQDGNRIEIALAGGMPSR